MSDKRLFVYTSRYNHKSSNIKFGDVFEIVKRKSQLFSSSVSSFKLISTGQIFEESFGTLSYISLELDSVLNLFTDINESLTYDIDMITSIESFLLYYDLEGYPDYRCYIVTTSFLDIPIGSVITEVIFDEDDDPISIIIDNKSYHLPYDEDYFNDNCTRLAKDNFQDLVKLYKENIPSLQVQYNALKDILIKYFKYSEQDILEQSQMDD